MFPLDSPRWSELRHAYGAAGDIPALLRQLEGFPVSLAYGDEPWHSLWGALCHQGDVYSASFAAVPHIIRVAESSPTRVSFSFLQLPAHIEIGRKRKKVEVPEDLKGAYFQALTRIPVLVAVAASREWDADFARTALCAIAASKGFEDMAEAIQEMTPEVATKFMDWFFEQR